MELEEAITKINEMQTSIEKLEGKNKELVREKQAIKAKVDGIDQDQYAKDLEQLNVLQGQVKDLEKVNKELSTNNESLANLAESKGQSLEKYLVESNLTDALVAAKVKPELMKAASAMFRSQTQIIEGEDGYSVNLGDKDIKTAITEWGASDEGKAFVSAPENQGGGSKQSNDVSGSQENNAAKDAANKGDLSGFLSASLQQA